MGQGRTGLEGVSSPRQVYIAPAYLSSRVRGRGEGGKTGLVERLHAGEGKHRGNV